MLEDVLEQVKKETQSALCKSSTAGQPSVDFNDGS